MRDINIFETGMFPYLEGEEIKGETLTLTIEDIRPEELQTHGGQKEVKEVLYFTETKKGFVLNKTNSKTIAMMYGRQTGQWAGKSITLTTEEVQAFGQLHNALRVVPGVISQGKPFPDNGPSKGAFFARAQEAGFEPAAAAAVLKAAGFTNGYDAAEASQMWDAIIKEYNIQKEAQIAAVHASRETTVPGLVYSNPTSIEQKMAQSTAVQTAADADDDLAKEFPQIYPDGTEPTVIKP